MQNIKQLVVVDSKVLPDIYIKVLTAKKMLAQGDVKSSVEACKTVGISRSTYYKYKDCVFTYEDKLNHKIISLHFVLKDEPGVLSSVLTTLYEIGTNVLTVNQNIPIDSVANVTISIRINVKSIANSMILSKLRKLYGVIDIKIISGE